MTCWLNHSAPKKDIFNVIQLRMHILFLSSPQQSILLYLFKFENKLYFFVIIIWSCCNVCGNGRSFATKAELAVVVAVNLPRSNSLMQNGTAVLWVRQLQGWARARAEEAAQGSVPQVHHRLPLGVPPHFQCKLALLWAFCFWLPLLCSQNANTPIRFYAFLSPPPQLSFVFAEFPMLFVLNDYLDTNKHILFGVKACGKDTTRTAAIADISCWDIFHFSVVHVVFVICVSEGQNRKYFRWNTRKWPEGKRSKLTVYSQLLTKYWFAVHY